MKQKIYVGLLNAERAALNPEWPVREVEIKENGKTEAPFSSEIFFVCYKKEIG